MVEVRGTLQHTQHLLPVQHCRCYHWPGFKKEVAIQGPMMVFGRWIRNGYRPLTKADIVAGWRAAAQGHKRDGNMEESRNCYRVARQIERTSGRRPLSRYYHF